MLQLKNIYKRLGNFQLSDINIDIKKSEYFVILGPTGTGKTVILETIAGMYTPDQGKIYFGGEEFSSLCIEDRGIGFVYQDYVLFPHLSVKDNIIFGLKVKKMPNSEIKIKLDNIVDLFKIEHLLDRDPRTLSGGEQQRVSLARALIQSPNILLLDEPLSALDPKTKESFQEMLKEIHEKMKITTIHITHDFNEALGLADRIAVMNNGKIMQVGTPFEIFNKPNSNFVANFVGVENIIKGNSNNNEVRLTSEIFIKTSTFKNGDITISFRPENVILSKDKTNSKNNFLGKITMLNTKGLLCKLHIDIGVNIISIMPTKLIEDMNIKLGDTVWASLDDSSVHVF